MFDVPVGFFVGVLDLSFFLCRVVSVLFEFLVAFVKFLVVMVFFGLSTFADDLRTKHNKFF